MVCNCCGEENIHGHIDHDNECIYFEPENVMKIQAHKSDTRKYPYVGVNHHGAGVVVFFISEKTGFCLGSVHQHKNRTTNNLHPPGHFSECWVEDFFEPTSITITNE